MWFWHHDARDDKTKQPTRESFSDGLDLRKWCKTYYGRYRCLIKAGGRFMGLKLCFTKAWPMLH